MTECRQCGQWVIKSTDDYCSYCGFLQLPISIEPLKLTLISEIVPEGKITFKNNGAKDLKIEILPANHSFDWLTFLPSNSFTLVSDDSTEIKVLVDDEKLPKDLGVKELKFVCMIDEDQRKTIELSIQVKAGPNPVALIDEIRFGDVEEGKDIESWVEIFNKGGVPLQFKNIAIEGSEQFQVKSKKSLEPLNPNEKVKIPVIWKSPEYDPNLDSNKLGLRIQFKNSSKELFIPIKGKLFKFQFASEPTRINISEALSKQTYSKEVTLINNGTKDIEVTAIESDKEWIQIVSKVNSFTLLCQDSKSRGMSTGPTVFAERFKFEVVLFPKKAEKKGINKGKIRVRTTKQDTFLEIEGQMNVIHPKKCHDYIGIDFGTTNSVVAIWDDEITNVRLIEEDNHGAMKPNPLIPSVLVFHGNPDNYKIGTEAEAEARTLPEVTVRSIKRIMGYGNDREFFGKNFSPEDLAALIIKRLREYAEERLFKIRKGRRDAYPDITKAIVTVPANFYDLQIRGILKACEMAGIDTEEEQAIKAANELKKEEGFDINVGIILDEPSAAALFYLSQFQERENFVKEFDEKFTKNEHIHFLIYDHGGGTLDVSVVQIGKLQEKNIGIKVLASKGDNTIGGDSIDITMMKELLKICKSQKEFKAFDDSLVSSYFNEIEEKRNNGNWDRAVWAEVLRARANWKQAAERLKIALDSSIETEFVFNKGGLDIFSINNGKISYIKEEFRTKVNRDKLTQWIRGILEKSQAVVRDALHLTDIKADRIDYIIHTGRSSLMPLIREKVKDVFPQLPKQYDILDQEYLKVCVAQGAALYGLIRSGIQREQHVRLVTGGRRLPHAYGVQVMRGFVPFFEPIIDVGEEYPTVGIKNYSVDEIPKSGILNLKFLQKSGGGDRIKENPDIRVIGSKTIDTLIDKKPGCDIKIIIDANRKMEVTADEEMVEIEPVRLEEGGRWIG
jgi:molecular chaperone DnaK